MSGAATSGFKQCSKADDGCRCTLAAVGGDESQVLLPRCCHQSGLAVLSASSQHLTAVVCGTAQHRAHAGSAVINNLALEIAAKSMQIMPGAMMYA
jgi:hypothetical protein